jgi:hypothetical protein
VRAAGQTALEHKKHTNAQRKHREPAQIDPKHRNQHNPLSKSKITRNQLHSMESLQIHWKSSESAGNWWNSHNGPSQPATPGGPSENLENLYRTNRKPMVRTCEGLARPPLTIRNTQMRNENTGNPHKSIQNAGTSTILCQRAKSH